MSTQRSKMARATSKRAIRYAKLCNLVETLWWHRDDFEPDFDDLLPFTSPQARRVASYIESLFDEYL
jgi:hypothetical protein